MRVGAVADGRKGVYTVRHSRTNPDNPSQICEAVSESMIPADNPHGKPSQAWGSVMLPFSARQLKTIPDTERQSLSQIGRKNQGA